MVKLLIIGNNSNIELDGGSFHTVSIDEYPVKIDIIIENKPDFIIIVLNDPEKTRLLLKLLRCKVEFDHIPIVVSDNNFSRIMKDLCLKTLNVFYSTYREISSDYIKQILLKQSKDISLNQKKDDNYQIKRSNSEILNEQMAYLFIDSIEIPTTINDIFDLIPMLCNADICIIILNNNISSKAFVKFNNDISQNSFDDFFRFCLHDHRINFKMIELDAVDYHFYNSDRLKKGVFSNENSVNSYYYTPVSYNDGRMLATLHLGSLTNNYFNQSSFIGGVQEFSYKAGLILSKIMDIGYEWSQLNEISSLFSKFVPDDIIDQIINKGTIEKKNERKIIAVLFSDIRSFTNITEQNPPESVIKFLNIYFNEMVETIKASSGLIDKFIGDAIVAVFEQKSDENIADKAYRAAVDMIKRQKAINADFIKLPQGFFKVGIGLHIGEVIAGNIGSEQKMAYTFIGETTGVAEHLEGLTKKYNTPILISEEFYNSLSIGREILVEVEKGIYMIKDLFL